MPAPLAAESLLALALKAAIERAGGKVFGPRPYDLTLFGVRTGDDQANSFNDFVGALYYDEDGALRAETFRATTDPGLYYRKNPLNVSGTAVLAAGVHPGLWKVGVHKGYPAFQQKGVARVHRDGDRDDRAEEVGPTTSGMYGINLHRTSVSGTSAIVDKWSAGCQVMATAGSLTRLLTLGNEQVKRYGANSFSYVLLREREL